MLHQLSANQQQVLSIAVLKLNTVGVKGVAEVLGSPRLQNPFIVFVKDRISGMTGLLTTRPDALSMELSLVLLVVVIALVPTRSSTWVIAHPT